MSRQLKPTLPQPPSGFEDRVIETQPRPACDSSAYEARIYAAVVAQSEASAEPFAIDKNLNGRVADTRKILASGEFLTSKDGPGESNWFVKNVYYTPCDYITLTFANASTSDLVFTLPAQPVHPEHTNPVYNGALEFSTDGYFWSALTIGSHVAPNSAHKVYVRGKIKKAGCCGCFGTSVGLLSVSGNLGALRDYSDVAADAQFDSEFEGLFDATGVSTHTFTNASELVIPPSTKKHTFRGMFYGCEALTGAPDFSGVQNEQYILYRTFYNCSALTTAPALPAYDHPAWCCFYEMFRGCVHLSSITAYVGTEVSGDALRDWLVAAGTQVNGSCYFYHSEGSFRWRFPANDGIPGPGIDAEHPSWYENWVPVPAMTTKIFYSASTGGTIYATVDGKRVASGEPVVYGKTVIFTAVPDPDYVVSSWPVKPVGATESGNTVTLAAMPYVREEMGPESVNCQVEFRRNANLSVKLKVQAQSTTFSDIALTRDPGNDSTKEGAPMYAWTGPANFPSIGTLYVDATSPVLSTHVWGLEDSTWVDYTASNKAEINTEIYTTNYTVVIADTVTTVADNITATRQDGRVFRNDEKEFCIFTAPIGSNVSVKLNLAAGEPTSWEDGVTDNPRIISPTVENRGIVIRRVAHTVTFSCTNGSVGATVDGIAIQSGASVAKGKSVIFTITPNAGYEYIGLSPVTVVVNADVTRTFNCTSSTHPLMFTSYGNSTIRFMNGGEGVWSGTWPIETSTDGTTWTSYTVGTQLTLTNGQSIYFRGQKDSEPQLTDAYRCFLITGAVFATGDVTSLLNGTGDVTDLTPYGAKTFFHLFDNGFTTGDRCLYSAPYLPSTTLVDRCYEEMFFKCFELRGPIKISATSPLISGVTACRAMFQNAGAETGAGGVIKVGGNVADWNQTNCGIGEPWTVEQL